MPVIEKDLIESVIKQLDISTKIILAQHKLAGSDMQKSIQWKFNNNAFELWALQYFDWVDKGRRPRIKRIPVEQIIKWMKKENIRPYRGQTYNQAAFHITNAIYKVGIKSRNYKNKIMEDSQEIISEMLAEELSIAIADELADDLTFTL